MSLKFPNHRQFHSTNHILTYSFPEISTTVIEEVSIGLAHRHNISNKLTPKRFTLLCGANQNGLRAGSVTEIIVEARSAARELVATPTAAATIAETDVVGSRKAVGIRGGNAGRSTIVYVTGTSAEVVDSFGTECNNCV